MNEDTIATHAKHIYLWSSRSYQTNN